MFLVTASSTAAAAAGGAVYVVRSSARGSAHIVSGAAITQVDVEAVNGLVNARALVHRPGGSIRVEFSEEYPCGDFAVRRGRIYHRNVVQCDVLEVELVGCGQMASAESILGAWIGLALPPELFEASADRDARSAGRTAPSHNIRAGPVHLSQGAGTPEGNARLFVEVARALHSGADGPAATAADEGRAGVTGATDQARSLTLKAPGPALVR
mmetsp:Transcript_33315/g.83024  ORF Transcript_33315/g.83024 Transcript_33315/m.83024 type:complete len:212 (+) Transcript_33315:216-851(+)